MAIQYDEDGRRIRLTEDQRQALSDDAQAAFAEKYPSITGPDGRKWVASVDTLPGGGFNRLNTMADLAPWSHIINGQVIDRDGTLYIPEDAANQIGAITNKPDFIQGLVEKTPLALGSAIVGYGAFGPNGFISGTDGLFPGGFSGGSGAESLLGEAGADTLGGLSELTPEVSTGVMGGPELTGGFDIGNFPWSDLSELTPSVTGVGGAAGGITAEAAKTALGRILDGSATDADYLSVLGTLGQAGAGIFAGLDQADSSQDLADQLLAFGTPSRERYEASFAPGFNPFDLPGYKDALDTSWDVGLRKASARAGNPIDNPGVMGELNKYITGSLGVNAINDYRRINKDAGFGTVTPYAQLSQNAITQQGGAWEAAGAGLENLLNPKPRYNINLGSFLT